MEENLPPGFRFHPTDEELIVYYLTHKVSDSSFTSRAIAVVDLKKCEPWDLPGKASMGEKEWYFFNLRDRKYPTGLRTNRATESGYWKTTGKDKEIFHTGVLVGMKKTLVFYKGRAPRGEKSNWVMHEYRLENRHPLKSTKEEWVVCRVFQKMLAVKKPQQTLSSQPSLDESHCETHSIANEFGDVKPQNLINSTITNSSTPLGNIMSSQNYNSDISEVNTNMNLNMNWPITSDQLPTIPSLQWPPGLLSTNLSVNSLLLKALQLKSTLQSRETATTLHNYAYMPPQPQPPTSHIGNELMSSDFNASSSKVLDYMASQQQQQQPEQPFNLDSINW